MQILSKIVDEGWCLSDTHSDGIFLAISTVEEANFNFDFVIVNGVRYEKPQSKPDE